MIKLLNLGEEQGITPVTGGDVEMLIVKMEGRVPMEVAIVQQVIAEIDARLTMLVTM